MSATIFPADLIVRMTKLGIHEDDLDEQFIQGAGSGGQKINKTSNCVRLVHRPSGREIRCQESRQREANRRLARELLCRKIEEEAAAAKLERQRVRALKRVEKRRPSPAEKRRRRESKQHRSSIKATRRKLADD